MTTGQERVVNNEAIMNGFIVSFLKNMIISITTCFISHIIMLLLVIFFCLLLTKSGYSLIGFTCGDTDGNYSAISTVSVGECSLSNLNIEEYKATLQLVQYNRLIKHPIYICKIVFTRTIFHCGMHSHASPTSRGFASYIIPVGESQCKQIIKTKEFTHRGVKHDGLTINSTTTRVVSVAGWANHNGQCNGAYFSDIHGEWWNVQVTAQYDILLMQTLGTLYIDDDTVITNAGVRCTFSHGYVFITYSFVLYKLFNIVCTYCKIKNDLYVLSSQITSCYLSRIPIMIKGKTSGGFVDRRPRSGPFIYPLPYKIKKVWFRRSKNRTCDYWIRSPETKPLSQTS